MSRERHFQQKFNFFSEFLRQPEEEDAFAFGERHVQQQLQQQQQQQQTIVSSTSAAAAAAAGPSPFKSELKSTQTGKLSEAGEVTLTFQLAEVRFEA